MQKLIQQFVHDSNNNQAIAQLIKNENFIVMIKWNEASCAIELKDKQFLATETIEVKPDYMMEGSSDSLKDIISGKVLLRAMVASNHVKVSATLRKLLFLESLFYLGNVMNTQNNINKEKVSP